MITLSIEEYLNEVVLYLTDIINLIQGKSN